MIAHLLMLNRWRRHCWIKAEIPFYLALSNFSRIFSHYLDFLRPNWDGTSFLSSSQVSICIVNYENIVKGVAKVNCFVAFCGLSILMSESLCLTRVWFLKMILRTEFTCWGWGSNELKITIRETGRYSAAVISFYGRERRGTIPVGQVKRRDHPLRSDGIVRNRVFRWQFFQFRWILMLMWRKQQN